MSNYPGSQNDPDNSTGDFLLAVAAIAVAALIFVSVLP